MAEVSERLRMLENCIMALDEKVGGLQKLEEQLPSQEKKTSRLQDGLFACLWRRLWGARRGPPVSTVPLSEQVK